MQMLGQFNKYYKNCEKILRKFAKIMRQDS